MKRILSGFLCLMLALALFAGCQSSRSLFAAPRTAKEALDGMREKMKTVKSMNADVEASFSLAFEMEGETEAIDLQLEMPAEITLSPVACHAKGTLTGSVAGEADQIELEFYAVVEDEMLEVYVKALGAELDDDGFTRFTVDIPDLLAEKPEQQEQAPFSEAAWTLREDGEDYVLTCRITEEDAKALTEQTLADIGHDDMLSAASGSTPSDPREMLQELYTGMEFTLRVERRTLALREIRIDYSGAVRVLLNEFMRTIEAMLNEDGAEDDEDAVKDASCILTFRIRDYDSVAPIVTPEDYDDLGSLNELMQGEIGSSDDWDVDAHYLDELDDTCRLGDFSFRVSEVTPSDFLSRGWTVTEYEGPVSYDDPLLIDDTDSVADDPEAAPEWTEDSTAGSDEQAQTETPQESVEKMILEPEELLYLTLSEPEDPTREGPKMSVQINVKNCGEIAQSCMDCSVNSIGVNQDAYDLDEETGEFKLKEAAMDFTSPGGVTGGMERAELTELLGEPFTFMGEEGEDFRFAYYTTQSGRTLILYLDDRDSVYSFVYFNEF